MATASFPTNPELSIKSALVSCEWLRQNLDRPNQVILDATYFSLCSWDRSFQMQQWIYPSRWLPVAVQVFQRLCCFWRYIKLAFVKFPCLMVRGHNGVDKRIYLGKQSRNSVRPVKQRGKFDSFYPIYNWVLHLEFNPCNDKCTYEGSHCQGCGRSYQEIADTKKWSCRLSTL